MPVPPHLLFVAERSAGAAALAAVRAGGPVRAHLAATADDLAAAFTRGVEFEAVVFVPGGPVEEVEVAVYVPDGLALFVVADEVPLLLTETVAVAIPEAELGTLAARLGATVEAPAPILPTLDPAPEAVDSASEAAHPAAETAPPVPEAGDPVATEREISSPPGQRLPRTRSGGEVEGGDSDERGADPSTTPDPSVPEPAPDRIRGGELPSDAEAGPTGSEAAGRTPDADASTPDNSRQGDTERHQAADPSGAMPAPLASLADHLPVGLYRSTPDGRILYANPALAHLLGADSVEALSAVDVRTDLGYPRQAFADEIRETGAVRNLVVSWVRPGGGRVHTRENARCLYDADGAVVAYEGTMEDVTAEVEAQLEERATARQHRAVAAFTAAAALAGDAATLGRAAASALVDATGAEWALLVCHRAQGSRIEATAGTFPTDLDAVYAAANAFGALPSTPIAAGSVAELAVTPAAAAVLAQLGVGALASVPVMTAGEPHGLLVWGRAQGAAGAPEARGAEALAWHLGGHLARAAALDDLRDSEASLAAIAAHTPHVLYRLRYTDAGPVYDYLSPAVERLTGYSREAVEARGGLGALVASRDVLEGEGLAAGPVDGADHYRAVYRLETADGDRWVENAARPWRDAAGRAVGLVGVLQDVTERRLREALVADAAQCALDRQRALVDLAHLDGADGYGASAAAITAATLGATAVSFWVCDGGGACLPLYAPSTDVPPPAVTGVLEHVARHRALAVADVSADARIASLGLGPFVAAYGLRSLLVAPIRRHGQVAGLVVVHRADGPHAWEPVETEFAAAVADALALALERADRERAVAALVDATEAAEAGREAAERMNRLKSSFLANMSHEFRTPLTGILGFADLLADDVPAEHQPYVRLIERNGRRLLDTLNSVLDLSRLEAGEYEADARPLPIAPAVRAATQAVAAEARAKGLRFDLDLDEAAAAALDPDALTRIMGHVVGNAVKFTDAGGVLVTVERVGETAVLRVADTGLGISPAFLDEVVGAFRQEDSGHARSHEGAGLGLTVADRLVGLLGGTIRIESERPGGTVVTMAFPLVASPAPARSAPPPASGDGHAGDGLPEVAEADPGDLLGAPFDFTFLSAPSIPPPAPAPAAVAPIPAPVAVDAVAAPPADDPVPTADAPAPAAPIDPPTPDSPASPPTDMFDFSFGRSTDPPPSPAAPAPEAAAPSPFGAPPSAAPRPMAPPAAPAAPPSRPAPAEDPVLIIRPRAPEPAATIPSAPAPPAEDAEVVEEVDPRPTVLVVEDNDDTRMLLERILRSTYRVTAVGDARSALLAMNAQRFAGLVLDINLGGKETGADVLRIARSLPAYDDVFAIALTAYALPGDRERLLESGFNAYVSKPFTRQVLMETLADGIAA